MMSESEDMQDNNQWLYSWSEENLIERRCCQVWWFRSHFLSIRWSSCYEIKDSSWINS